MLPINQDVSHHLGEHLLVFDAWNFCHTDRANYLNCDTLMRSAYNNEYGEMPPRGSRATDVIRIHKDRMRQVIFEILEEPYLLHHVVKKHGIPLDFLYAQFESWETSDLMGMVIPYLGRIPNAFTYFANNLSIERLREMTTIYADGTDDTYESDLSNWFLAILDRFLQEGDLQWAEKADRVWNERSLL